MLFQQVTADTTGYMIFGYVVIFGSMIIYLLSLISRWRNLQKDEEILQEIED